MYLGAHRILIILKHLLFRPFNGEAKMILNFERILGLFSGIQSNYNSPKTGGEC